jgi:putative flippase GtrA
MSSFFSKHQKKIRFLVVGVMNTAVGLAMYPLLYTLLRPFEIDYIGTLIFSQIICITFSFISNKYFVFKTKGNIKKEYPKFFAFYGIYFLLNLVCLPFMVEILNLNPMIAQTIFSIAIVASSYFWHNMITFKYIKEGIK